MLPTFEWCDEGDPFEGRYDENVFSFEVSHAEGEFATLRVEIRNPRTGLLRPDRQQWAQLGIDDGSTGGPTLLFKGRIVGIPEAISEEVIAVQFIARPSDYDAQKAALAETLKTPPFWDRVWINPNEADNPDVVLEARPQHWHIDRVTHEVTVSDIITGEDGTITLADEERAENGLEVTYRDSPVTSISCEAAVSWEQAARGSIDLRPVLLQAFAAAGSPYGTATSLTGEGLQRDWPKRGDSIGAGWSVGDSYLVRIDGTYYPTQLVSVELTEARAGFPVWVFDPHFSADYDVSRSRRETIRFTITADVQPLTVEQGEDTTLSVRISSQEVASLIDGSVTAGFTAPIVDVRRPSYFKTPRGKQSLEYAIVLCRARLLARARAVEVSDIITFERASTLSCRMSIAIPDERLPGGGATGKVIAYSFGLNGENGEPYGRVTIGCTVGRGGTVSAPASSGSYAAAGYMTTGYQAAEGGATLLAGSSIAYSDFGTAPIDDDGVNLLGLTASSSVLSCVVVDGEAAQQAALQAGSLEDVGAAIEVVNGVYTRVALDLLPLTGGPFQTDFAIEVTPLVVPKTIDLEAP